MEERRQPRNEPAAFQCEEGGRQEVTRKGSPEVARTPGYGGLEAKREKPLKESEYQLW